MASRRGEVGSGLQRAQHAAPWESNPNRAGGTAMFTAGCKLEAQTRRSVPGESPALGKQHRKQLRKLTAGPIGDWKPGENTRHSAAFCVILRLRLIPRLCCAVPLVK